MNAMTVRYTSRSRSIVGALLAIALGAGVSLLIARVLADTEVAEPGSSGRPLEAIFDQSEPLLLPGEKVPDLGTAERAIGLPLPGLSDASPTEVWVSETGEAGARFGDSLVLLYAPIDPKRDPASVYATEAADWKIGYTTKLQGFPAWVVPDHEGNPAPGVAVIHVAMDGVEVKLFGKMSAEELLGEAASLDKSP